MNQNNNFNQLPNSNNQTTENQDFEQETQQEITQQYLDFKPGIIKNTVGRRVLFFYANWCPTCRSADADLKKNIAQLQDDIIVIKINYNDDDTQASEEALAKKYGITYQLPPPPPPPPPPEKPPPEL